MKQQSVYSFVCSCFNRFAFFFIGGSALSIWIGGLLLGGRCPHVQKRIMASILALNIGILCGETHLVAEKAAEPCAIRLSAQVLERAVALTFGFVKLGKAMSALRICGAPKNALA